MSHIYEGVSVIAGVGGVSKQNGIASAVYG